LSEDPGEQVAGEPSFESVKEALRQAHDDFDSIQVWSSAVESAEESTFPRPGEVYDALKVIAKLAEIDADPDRSSGPWKQFFERRGFKYASGESEQTMNLHGDERNFHDRRTGKRMQMERHLTLGGASRENCEQIFFERSETSDKFVIGYCGRHLPFASQTT
jgi:hypothetical protein